MIVFLLFLFTSLAQADSARLLSEGKASIQARLDSIQNARRQILVETFYLENDAVGLSILHSLVEKKEKSPEVDIRLVTDAWGSATLTKEAICFLKARNLGWRIFNPMKKNAPFKSQIRDHRKIWVTDQTAIIGGRNLSEENLDKYDWDVEVKGAVREAIASSFEDMWTASEEVNCAKVTPSLPVKPKLARVAVESRWHEAGLSWFADKPFEEKKTTSVVLDQIREARKTLWVETGFFSPDKTFMEALSSSPADVTILLNPPWTGYWAGELATCASLRYQKLLAATGHAYIVYPEKTKATHGKLILVDEVEVGIGSFNLHQKSISDNAETWLVMKNSPTLVQEITEEFQKRVESGNNFRELDNHHSLNELDEQALRRCKKIERLAPIFRPFI